MRRPVLAMFLVAAALHLPGQAAGQRVIHKIRFGETLGSISKYYYGGRKHAQLLREINNLDKTKKISAGDRIRIPTAWVHTVRRPISARALAKKLLGDHRRWEAFNLANRVHAGRRIRAKTRLVIPFIMKISAAPGETFVDLSKRFFGTNKYAALIAAFNFIKAARPPPASQIEIPIAHLRIAPLIMERLTNERLLGVSPKPSQDHRRALQEANALLRRGDYWSVPLRLVRVLARDHSSDSQMAEIFKLLAIAYVAVHHKDLAIAAFREALLRLPTMTLDPVMTSPKVIRAFVDAKSMMRKGP